MAFLGERRRLEGDVCGKDLQRALWTDPPKVRIMPGIPRKLDYQGRMKYKKDCDEVFPQIMIGTGDCIKDVSLNSKLLKGIWQIQRIQKNFNSLARLPDDFLLYK